MGLYKLLAGINVYLQDSFLVKINGFAREIPLIVSISYILGRTFVQNWTVFAITSGTEKMLSPTQDILERLH